jgi:hypothetical protein
MRLLLALVLSVFAATAAGQERLNVVLLYADDWRHDTLGCAGHPVVRTPNLDRLARDGVRFTHACVTTAICGISRANLLTGQWMSRHGCRDFGPFRTPWDQTLPGLRRADGWAMESGPRPRAPPHTVRWRASETRGCPRQPIRTALARRGVH